MLRLLLILVASAVCCAFETSLRWLPRSRLYLRGAVSHRSVLTRCATAPLARRDLFSTAAGACSVLAMAGATPQPKPEAAGGVVGWGIVGLGDVCAVKAGPAFVKAEGSRLVAVMRRTPGKAQEWASANVPGGECRGYSDLDAFLSDPDVTAVYIATPPGAHLEVAQKVAASGRAAYIEKPVGRSYREAQAIAQAFAERGLALFTAYTSRALERSEHVRRTLASGAIGPRVTSISYSCRGAGLARGLEQDDGARLPWRLVASSSGGGLVWLQHASLARGWRAWKRLHGVAALPPPSSLLTRGARIR